jgi:hypothetical protein
MAGSLSYSYPAPPSRPIQPVPAKGSKLVKAFLQIEDFKRRAEIIKMVEEASALKKG